MTTRLKAKVRRGRQAGDNKTPDPYKRLAGAVCLQAMADLVNRSASLEKRCEALTWLTTQEGQALFLTLDIPNPLEHFTTMSDMRKAARKIDTYWRRK